MYSRPNWDEYYLRLLDGIKSRASCPRRQCGAILVDKDYVLLSTGYNGPPSKLSNCTDMPCGAETGVSGDTSTCLALHAEHNAIYFAKYNIDKATTLYCTHSPCLKCCLEILQTPITSVIYLEQYTDTIGLNLLRRAGIVCYQMKSELALT